MKITHVLAIAASALLLSGMSSQSQVEGTAPAVAGVGPEHIHNVQGFGDLKHSHAGNSTAQHSHSWAEIQAEIHKRKAMQ